MYIYIQICCAKCLFDKCVRHIIQKINQCAFFSLKFPIVMWDECAIHFDAIIIPYSKLPSFETDEHLFVSYFYRKTKFTEKKKQTIILHFRDTNTSFANAVVNRNRQYCESCEFVMLDVLTKCLFVISREFDQIKSIKSQQIINWMPIVNNA